DVEEVADRGPGGAGHHADPKRQKGDRLLSRRVEEPIWGELLLELLESEGERSRADRLERIADDLRIAARLVEGDAPAGDHLLAVVRAEAEQPRLPAEEHRADLGALVLEAEVEVARGRPAEVRDLAAHVHRPELPLQGAPDATGELPHRQHGRRRQIDRRRRLPAPRPAFAHSTPLTGVLRRASEEFELGLARQADLRGNFRAPPYNRADRQCVARRAGMRPPLRAAPTRPLSRRPPHRPPPGDAAPHAVRASEAASID